MLDSSKKLKNLHIYFWSTLRRTTSWLLLFLPIVLPCPTAVFSRLLLLGWKTIGLAQCSSMTFRSVAPLGPVATFTPMQLLLRSLSIDTRIVYSFGNNDGNSNGNGKATVTTTATATAMAMGTAMALVTATATAAGAAAVAAVAAAAAAGRRRR
jgi:hypothetical protein